MKSTQSAASVAVKCTFFEFLNNEGGLIIPYDSPNKKTEIRVIIPSIQRDYAQGRLTDYVGRVREDFLAKIHEVLSGDGELTLDFIYGELDMQVVTPLDGQQRLTTLFLLHWYAAKKCHESDCDFLSRFSYETRYSSRDFCKELLSYSPRWDDLHMNGRTLSSDIADQHWFAAEWLKDPTIAGMLVMLDAIDAKFNDCSNLWTRLKEQRAVSFYFLPLKKLGMTDEIYIKMNARGKPLTEFEHFKAQWKRRMESVLAESDVEDIMANVDGLWTNILWKYCRLEGEHMETVDNLFLHYIRYICRIICWESGVKEEEDDAGHLSLLRHLECRQHIELLSSFFSCWNKKYEYCKTIFSRDRDGEHVWTGDNNVDLFARCLREKNLSNKSSMLLYAVISHLTDPRPCSEDEFIRRLRIVNNLLEYSSDESDMKKRQLILCHIVSIIRDGFKLDGEPYKAFNAEQLEEERAKYAWAVQRTGSEEEKELRKLEDHELLRGQVGILDWADCEQRRRFECVFAECNRAGAERVLVYLGEGTYPQMETVNRYRFVIPQRSEMWRRLFGDKRGSDYASRKELLTALLNRCAGKTEQEVQAELTGIAEQFCSDCESAKLYPWHYYYVRYDAFRPPCNWERYQPYKGKYWMRARCNYYCFVMRTSSAAHSYYSPFLRAALDLQLEKSEKCGYTVSQNVLSCPPFNLSMEEHEVKVTELLEEGKETAPVSFRIPCKEGVDTEDRVQFLSRIIAIIHEQQPQGLASLKSSVALQNADS